MRDKSLCGTPLYSFLLLFLNFKFVIVNNRNSNHLTHLLMWLMFSYSIVDRHLDTSPIFNVHVAFHVEHSHIASSTKPDSVFLVHIYRLLFMSKRADKYALIVRSLCSRPLHLNCIDAYQQSAADVAFTNSFLSRTFYVRM